MKSAEVKNSTSSSKSSKPFFNKGGEASFFAQKKETNVPFFQAMLIQPALAVGAPNDPFEQEADKVGRQVMDNFGQASTIQTKLSNLGVQTSLIQPMPIGTRISRMVQHRQNIAQAKCENCEEEIIAQPKSLGIQFAGEGGMVSSNIEQRINSQRGTGSSMDTQTKGVMESSFGADFSSVNIHTGTPAVQMSHELNAHAFTVGSDIFFNKGKYQPQTKEGAGLLAHELTHTVQQGAAVQNKRINRRPLSQMLSKHEMAHLSTMNSGNTLSRKEMAQLERMPEEEMMQQKEIFESKEVDKVQKKDSGLSLRRCGGSSTPQTSVNSWVTKTSNNTSTDNCCGVCPITLGVDSSSGTKFTNAIQLKAILDNHATGNTYDIYRTKHRKTFKKVGGTWTNLTDTGANAADDSHDSDECLTPIASGGKHHIYSVDAPGFPNTADPVGDNTATEAAYIANFTESVKINGTEDSTKKNWHSVMWVTNTGGAWSVNTTNSEITTGHRSSLSP